MSRFASATFHKIHKHGIYVFLTWNFKGFLQFECFSLTFTPSHFNRDLGKYFDWLMSCIPRWTNCSIQYEFKQLFLHKTSSSRFLTSGFIRSNAFSQLLYQLGGSLHLYFVGPDTFQNITELKLETFFSSNNCEICFRLASPKQAGSI